MAAAVSVAASPHPPSPQPSPPWLDLMRADLGLAEVPGAAHNPRVLAMFRTVGRPDVTDDDETSWCAACVGHYLVKAGVRLADLPGKEERLLARAYLHFGLPLDVPAPGCIVVIRRGRAEWQGHVFLFLRTVEVDGVPHMEGIGGNQSNAITIARFPASRLVGYRWPPGFAPPKAGGRAVEGGQGPALSSRPFPPATGPVAGAVAGASGVAVAVQSGAPWWIAAMVLALLVAGVGFLLLFRNR